MNTTPENQQKKHICAALLAHVDAGKTTLSEALLYESGVIRTRGRVDHKDAFWIPHRWNGNEELQFFPNKHAFRMEIWMLRC